MKILLSPGQAILDAKKERSLTKSVIVLLISALLFVATIAVVSQFMNMPLNMLIDLKFPIIIWAFLIVFLGGMFFGLILPITINILGGNGDYFDGLTSISYFLLPFSIGIFLSFTINFAPLKITDANLLLLKGLIVFAISVLFTADGVAILYRAIKELFETDMIVASVGVLVIGTALIIPFYLLIFQSIFGIFSIFSGLGSMSPIQ